jgi:hypothetical protein
MRWPDLLAFLTAAIILTTTTGSAQSQQAIVTGRVTRQGEPSERLMVRVAANYGYTDVEGTYRLRGVPYGTARIEVVRGNKVILSESVDVHEPVVQHDLLLQ